MGKSLDEKSKTYIMRELQKADFTARDDLIVNELDKSDLPSHIESENSDRFYEQQIAFYEQQAELISLENE